MLRTTGDRGLRAAKSLCQLNKLYNTEQGIFRAATERASLIESFITGELTTDGVQLAVDAIIARIEQEKAQRAKEEMPPEVPLVEIRRQERMTTLLKRFAGWQKLIGDQPLYCSVNISLQHALLKKGPSFSQAKDRAV